MIWPISRPRILNRLQPLTSFDSLPSEQLRKLGMIYNLYRCVVSGFMMLTSLVAFPGPSIDSLPSLLQQITLSLYLLFSLILLSLFYLINKAAPQQLALGLTIDVVVLSLLLFSNGAPDLQLTMLYMVVVAASFMLLTAPQALIITLLAVILVIYQQFFFAITQRLHSANLSDALLMSMSFLTVAFFSWAASRRLIVVEKMADIQAKQVSRLNAINHEIISKMVSGVLVIDNNQVILANQAACDLLHINTAATTGKQALTLLQHQLTSLHPVLCDWYLSFQHQDCNVTDEPLANNLHRSLAEKYLAKQYNASDIIAPPTAAKATRSHLYTFIYQLPPFACNSVVDKLRVELTPLKHNSQLLILEDLRREQAGAQQLKLASLGQLTASIAHEIRNPLAAISQASQLLLEELNEAERQGGANRPEHQPASYAEEHGELYQMIFAQTKRVNRIIEDVLKLSRQQPPQRQPILIADWLQRFLSEHYPNEQVDVGIKATPTIYFDPHQLEQILLNLINNGLRYSRQAGCEGHVEVLLYRLNNDAIIDILDTGVGIDSADQAQLFKPFFTTDIHGTGLGLYLSQAFSEANHARLLYVPHHQQTCFRLIVPLSDSASEASAP